jgi:hypothetical protein
VIALLTVAFVVTNNVAASGCTGLGADRTATVAADHFVAEQIYDFYTPFAKTVFGHFLTDSIE